MKRLLLILLLLPVVGAVAQQAPNTWQAQAYIGTPARAGAACFTLGQSAYIGTGSGIGMLSDFLRYTPAGNGLTSGTSYGGGPRVYSFAFSIGDKGYVGGGTISSATYYDDLWEYDSTSGVWTQKASVPGGTRSGGVGFSIGAKGYVGTGYGWGGYKSDFWEYDPAANAWTQRASFAGGGRVYASAFVAGQSAYVGTGENAQGATNDFWRYSPLTDTWVQKASLPGVRSKAAAFAINGTGYVGTGYNGAYLQDFYAYDTAANSWSAKANFGGGPRRDAVGFALSGNGYIATGTDGAAKSDIWRYNPQTNAWTLLLSPVGSQQREYAAGFSIGTKGYIGTGYYSASTALNFWEFDAQNNVWTQKADFGGTARYAATGFSIGSKGYIGTGISAASASVGDLWEYNPATNAWTQKASMPGNGRAGATSFSTGGKGYVCLGNFNGGSVVYNDLWEYNPVTDGWTQKANFGGSARSGACAFVAGGKAYVGTGADNSPALYRNDFWEYDPATNAWTQKADFGGGDRHGAVAFSAGPVGYVATGGSNAYPYRNDVWMYNPASNTWTQKTSLAGAARVHAVAFAVGSAGYIGTGWYGNYAADLWRYESDYLQAGAPASTSFCAGAAVMVPVLSGAGYGAGNVFTVQLSNASGSFANPVTIGTLASATAPASIGCTLPAGTNTGTGYRIRVISSNPAITGLDNGINLSITAIVGPSISISTPATAICNGSSATFTATAVNASPAPFYQWKVNGQNAGTNSSTFSYVPANGDVVSCRVTTVATACAGVDSALSNAITMATILPLGGTVSISTATTTVCYGVTTSIQATTSVTGGSYLWKRNNVAVGGNSAGLNIVLNNGDVVTCTVTPPTGVCYTNSSYGSNSLAFTVLPPVVNTVTIAQTSPSTCPGVPVTFTATGQPGYTYQWRINNNYPAGATNPTYTYTPSNGDMILVYANNSALQCSNPNFSNIISYTPGTMVTPVLNVVWLGNDSICAGLPAVLNAFTNASGHFNWKVNGVYSGPDNPVFTYVPANGDVVSCVLSDIQLSSGCYSLNAVASNSVVMPVQSSTRPGISISGPLWAPPGSDVALHANLTNPSSSYIIEWKNNGVPMMQTTQPDITYTRGSGTDLITATLRTNAICALDTTSAVHPVGDAGLAVGPAGSTRQLLISPLPFSARLKIGGLRSGEQIQLYAANGQLLLRSTARAAEELIATEQLPAGTYLLRIVNAAGELVQRQMISKQ